MCIRLSLFCLFWLGLFFPATSTTLFSMTPLVKTHTHKIFFIATIFLVLHSWNIFLFLCSLPSLFSGFAYIFMPETPKFLMAKGQTQKAMEVFAWVYSLNTGKSPDSYPVIYLQKTSKKQAIN